MKRIPVLNAAGFLGKKIFMPEVVKLMRRSMEMLKSGYLDAPPRKVVKLAKDSFSYTIGAFDSPQLSVKGWRAYLASTPDNDRLSELTVVYEGNGQIAGIILGKELGEWRTGAIGGLAIDILAPLKTHSLGLVGSGRQAFTQLLAAFAVREFETVKIFSRNVGNCRKFVAKIKKITGKKLQIATDMRDLVKSSDVLICATSSSKPIFQNEWLKKKIHINNVGPKLINNHELPIQTYESAELLVTDSLGQLEDLGEKFVFNRSAGAVSAVQLSDLLARSPAGKYNRTIFVSQGLAGTEVILANEILRRSKNL